MHVQSRYDLLYHYVHTAQETGMCIARSIDGGASCMQLLDLSLALCTVDERVMSMHALMHATASSDSDSDSHACMAIERQ